ncbi:MAG: FAD-dependent oxidoreductase [Polyangia bacterium]
MFLLHSDVLVIGGNAAGIAAALTARRQYPDKSVSLVRPEDRVLISCGIPYVFGTLGSPEKNFISNEILENNGIKLFKGLATRIDRENRLVEMENGDTLGFEKLVLATGSNPAINPIPGFDLKNIFTVQKDTDALRELQKRLEESEKLAIVGGGFIGVSLADQFKAAKVAEVTIVTELEHCLADSFDEEFCVAAERKLTERGVRFETGQRIEELTGTGAVDTIVLENGSQLAADTLVFAVGAVANSKLAKDSGLELGATGGVAVDRNMQTSDPAIFACGDCAEKVGFFGGKPTAIKLASIACAEARVAGANLFGIRRENAGTMDAWSTAVGDLYLSRVGLTASAARGAGYDCVTGSVTEPDRHPPEMPGAVDTTVKLVFERRTNVLIGAQLMGSTAVGEMTNVLSACIKHRMNIDDIATFQFATHPSMTSSPLTHQTVNAAEMAHEKTRQ